MTTKTDKNTLKNLWKKPLAGLLGLSILASMSTACIANEKHESKGWVYNAFKYGVDWDEILVLNQEEIKVVRKLRLIAKKREKEYAAANDMDKFTQYDKILLNDKFQEEEAKKLSKAEKIALDSYSLKVKNHLRNMGLN